jgi:hypothetical protein
MVGTAEIRKTLTDRKPLYAVAGAGDFAVGKLRARLAALRGELKPEPRAVRARLGHLPADVRALPEKAETFARGRLGKAGEAYEDLAERGHSAVGRIRRQKPTRELAEHVEISERQVRATGAAARKRAAGTSRAAKATVTEAKKTAAAKAEASTDKIGD